MEIAQLIITRSKIVDIDISGDLYAILFSISSNSQTKAMLPPLEEFIHVLTLITLTRTKERLKKYPNMKRYIK